MSRTLTVGVVGKGGAGKTTVSARLAETYAARGMRVVAVDTDSNPNLGLSLGLDLATVDALPALPTTAVTGTRTGPGSADALLSEYGTATPSGVTLLTALRVAEAASGCQCGGHRTVRSLLGDALARSTDVTVVDMEAGLEHLSRSGGTLAHADTLVTVVEPTRTSVVTAGRTQALAAELGLDVVLALGNKVRSDDDRTYLEQACADQGVRLVAVVPFDEAVAAADRGGGVGTPAPGVQAAVDALVTALDATVPARRGADRS
jgi:CO dehydrogenase maturation factor